MRHSAPDFTDALVRAVAGNVPRDGRPEEVRRPLGRLRRGDEHLLDRPGRGRADVPRLRHRRAGRERELRGGRLPPARGRAAARRRARRVQGAAGGRARAAACGDDDHRRERDGRLADGDDAHGRLGAVLLRRGRGRDRPRERAPEGRDPDRAAADDRGALRAPPPRRAGRRSRPVARLRRELPDDAARRGAHRRGGAGVRGRDDPPRRARDERVDVHGARRRRHERRHALGDRRRDLGAEGAAPRRRQPGRDGDVRRVRQRRRRRRGRPRAARGEAAAVRLRPSALPRDGSARADPAPALGAVRGRERAQLPRDRPGRRARGARAEGPLAERRPLLGRALPLPRDPDRPLHPALRDEPRRRPGGARARAARGRQDHPAERRVHRRAAPRLSGRGRAAGAR